MANLICIPAYSVRRYDQRGDFALLLCVLGLDCLGQDCCIKCQQMYMHLCSGTRMPRKKTTMAYLLSHCGRRVRPPGYFSSPRTGLHALSTCIFPRGRPAARFRIAFVSYLFMFVTHGELLSPCIWPLVR
jgi:hypothetical protein